MDIRAKAVPGNSLDREYGTRVVPGSRDVFSIEQLLVVYNIIEFSVVLIASYGSASLYWIHGIGWEPEPREILVPSVLLACAISALSLASGRMRPMQESRAAFLWNGAVATVKAFAFLIAALFMARTLDEYSRGAFLAQFAVVMFVLLSSRSLFQSLARHLLAIGRVETDRVMVVGGLANDRSFLHRIASQGIRVVAANPLSDIAGEQDQADKVREIVDVCRAYSVQEVVATKDAAEGAFAELLVEALGETPTTIRFLPNAVVPCWSRGTTDSFKTIPAAVVTNRPLSAFDQALKRGFDIVVSIIAIVLLAPIFLIVGLAIKLDSRGPVLFRQTRHGYSNKPIRVFKFRSMRVMEDGAAFRQATRNDPRITAVGRMIRKTNIDELPQLFNVLLGEMSIVGPRPHPIALNETFASRIRRFHRRHNIRPGITGWAQVSGFRGETDTFEKMAGRIEHDLWYIDNWSFLLDLKILVLTVFSPSAYRDAR
ncbi:MAG: undecaprenyl-phosphate glucose phosphotransferase [Beijerinckiaceae bacterium]|nr:undecaprenyl-phosphate glucose phosphotransferase [Beijerinckiaceae bacterium]